MRVAPLLAAALVASCSSQSPEVEEPVELTKDAQPDTPMPVRASAEATALAKQDLEAWSMVIEVMHDPKLQVPWTIGVADDGTPRTGLAETVCITLREHGAVDDFTTVRIVDRDRAIAGNGDFRAASLGHVDCNSGQDLGV